MKTIMLVLALFISMPASAGELYLDLGAAYLSELAIKQTASFEFMGQTLTLEKKAELDVDQFVPMARLGYLFKNHVGVEYSYVGVPGMSLHRINTFYRFK